MADVELGVVRDMMGLFDLSRYLVKLSSISSIRRTGLCD